MGVKVVFDCMVFLQGAARAEGPAAACLRLAEAGYAELFLSAEILDELRDVLTRPKIRKKFPSLTHETVEARGKSCREATGHLGKQAQRPCPVSPAAGCAVGVADKYSPTGTTAKFLQPSPLTLRELEGDVESLVARYTARHGFRTYDIVHVASARALGCSRFLTFDAKARTLAQLVGM